MPTKSHTDRFEHDPQEFVEVADPKLIYVGLDSRTAFDLIARPCTDHCENEKGHVLFKTVEQAGVRVVFQYWLKSLTIEAITEDGRRRKADV